MEGPGSTASQQVGSSCLELVPYVGGLSPAPAPSETPAPSISSRDGSSRGPQKRHSDVVFMSTARSEAGDWDASALDAPTPTSTSLPRGGLHQCICMVPGCDVMVLRHPTK